MVFDIMGIDHECDFKSYSPIYLEDIASEREVFHLGVHFPLGQWRGQAKARGLGLHPFSHASDRNLRA